MASADDGQAAFGPAMAALAQRIRAGDPAAELELCSTWQRGVRLLVQRRCRHGDPQVDDLVQEVLAELLRQLRAGAVRDLHMLPAYLRGIVQRRCASLHRRRAAQLQAVPTTTHAAPPTDPLQQALQHERCDRLLQLIDSLGGRRDRELLVRFCLREQDRAEVCSALALDAGQFRRALSRARSRIRALLLQDGR